MSSARKSVVQLLNSIEGMWPNWRRDEKTVILWHIALQEVSDDQILAAIPKMIRGHRSGFAPTAGEFLNFVEDGRDSDVAWQDLLRAVQRLGAYRIPIFSHDTRIAETVRRLGGWVKICRSKEGDLPFVRKDFIAIYDSLNGKDYPTFLSGMRGAELVEYQPLEGRLELPAPPEEEAPVLPSPEDSRKMLFALTKKIREKNLTPDLDSQ